MYKEPEWITYKQMNNFMENKFLKCIIEFRKSHGSQDFLVVMQEKCQKPLNIEKNNLAVFMNFSKAFNVINHGILS